MFTLRLLGGAALSGPDGPVRGRAAQRQRLALLAQLAGAQPYGVSRDKLIAYFWPEAETDRARRLLSASVYVLRQALGDAAIVAAGDEMALDSDVVRSDVGDFEAALDAGELESAVSLYRGPFLDGFFLRDADEFERWAEAERIRLAHRYAGALERLARDATARGDTDGAVNWWRALTASDPLSSRAALGLMEALAAAGDSAGALQHARGHERLVQEELGSPPDPNIVAFRERLCTVPALPPRAPEGTRSPAPRAAKQTDDRIGPLSHLDSEGPPPATPLRDQSPVEPARVNAPPASRTLPLRRSRWLAGSGVAAALVFLVLAVLGGRHRGTAAASPEIDLRRVDVVVFVNMTGDSTLDRLGQIAADWISQGLARTRLVHVMPVGLDSWAGDRPPASGEPRGSLAGARVVGAFYRQEDSLRFQARLVDWTGEQIGAMDPATTPVSHPLAGVERVRQQVTALLATHVDPNMSAWATAGRQPTSFVAYDEFAAGMEAFVRADMSAAHERFMASADADAGYMLPVLWAVFSSANAGRFPVSDSLLRGLEPARQQMTGFEAALLDYHLANRAWNYEAAYRATQRMVDIAPGSEWHYLLAMSALRSHRPREAVQQLARLDPNRGWLRGEFGVNYWLVFSAALHWLKDYERELQTVRLGLNRYQGDVALKISEAAALAALGRLEEVDSAAATVVAWTRSGGERLAAYRAIYTELTAHGHREAALRHARAAAALYSGLPEAERRLPAARFWYVPALNAAENFDSAQAVSERLVAEYPSNPTYRIQLGVVAALGGNRERAMEILGTLQGDDPVARYRRGLVLAALGDHEGAVNEMRDVLLGRAGPDSVWWEHPHPRTVANDFRTRHRHPGLQSLWSYPPFVELMQPKDVPQVATSRWR
jgi:DNA-binding SARP family transcriptional activator/tetratricopeptide (TPR) repeat protein